MLRALVFVLTLTLVYGVLKNQQYFDEFKDELDQDRRLSIFSTIGKQIHKAGQSIDNKIGKVAKSVGKTVLNTAKQIDDTAVDIKEQVVDKVKDVSKQAKNIVQHVKANVKEAVDGVKDTANNIQGKVKTQGNKINKKVKAVTEDFKDLINDIKEKVVDTVEIQGEEDKGKSQEDIQQDEEQQEIEENTPEQNDNKIEKIADDQLAVAKAKISQKMQELGVVPIKEEETPIDQERDYDPKYKLTLTDAFVNHTKQIIEAREEDLKKMVVSQGLEEEEVQEEVNAMKNVTMKLTVVDQHSVPSQLKMVRSYMRMTNTQMIIDQGWTLAKQEASIRKAKGLDEEEEIEEGLNGEWNINLVNIELLGLSPQLFFENTDLFYKYSQVYAKQMCRVVKKDRFEQQRGKTLNNMLVYLDSLSPSTKEQCRVSVYIQRGPDSNSILNSYRLLLICLQKQEQFQDIVDLVKDKYAFNLKKNRLFNELPSLGEQLSYKVSLQSGDTKVAGRILLGGDFMSVTTEGWYSNYVIDYSAIRDCTVYQNQTMAKSYHPYCCINFYSTSYNSQAASETLVCRKFTGIEKSLEMQAYCYYFFNQLAQSIENKCHRRNIQDQIEATPLTKVFQKEPALLSLQLASLSQQISKLADVQQRFDLGIQQAEKVKAKLAEELKNAKGDNDPLKAVLENNKQMEQKIKQIQDELKLTKEELKQKMEKEAAARRGEVLEAPQQQDPDDDTCEVLQASQQYLKRKREDKTNQENFIREKRQRDNEDKAGEILRQKEAEEAAKQKAMIQKTLDEIKKQNKQIMAGLTQKSMEGRCYEGDDEQTKDDSQQEQVSKENQDNDLIQNDGGQQQKEMAKDQMVEENKENNLGKEAQQNNNKKQALQSGAQPSDIPS